MVLTFTNKEPTNCDECDKPLIGKGCCSFVDKDGKEVTICLSCATIKALKNEYPFNEGEKINK